MPADASCQVPEGSLVDDGVTGYLRGVVVVVVVVADVVDCCLASQRDDGVNARGLARAGGSFDLADADLDDGVSSIARGFV
jgi:hypothetical protein